MSRHFSPGEAYKLLSEQVTLMGGARGLDNAQLEWLRCEAAQMAGL